MMRSLRLSILTLLTVAVLGLALSLTAETPSPGANAFETLKGLAGTWHGTESMGQTDAVHVIEVSAAGTVVMETMFPDTDHEMINMYHLDGDDLVLTHYCAGGNQPTMKLVEAKDGTLRFDFTGGTNLDPSVDHHIHAAELVVGDETLSSRWTAWGEGQETGVNVIELTRSE